METQLTIRVFFKNGNVNYITWADCHDFKIEEGLVTFWNLNEDKEKVEKIIPLCEVQRILKMHFKVDKKEEDLND